jgi:uncharacterized membrane protein YphA (DoxX/SURF4 family)
MFEKKELGGPIGAAAVGARSLIAVIFVASGAVKLLMYSEQVEMFIEWGVPFPEAFVPLVGVVEVAAGVAVLLGFLGRTAATVLAVVMVGAVVTAGPNGLNVFSFLICAFVAVNGVGGWYVLTEKEALSVLTER